MLLNDLLSSPRHNFFLLAGPCVIEGEEMAMDIAEKALRILRKVGETFNIPVVTDIHEPVEADIAAEYVDVLQIPAFLCRQTELLVAAAHTGRVVNICRITRVD